MKFQTVKIRTDHYKYTAQDGGVMTTFGCHSCAGSVCVWFQLLGAIQIVTDTVVVLVYVL